MSLKQSWNKLQHGDRIVLIAGVVTLAITAGVTPFNPFDLGSICVLGGRSKLSKESSSSSQKLDTGT